MAEDFLNKNGLYMDELTKKIRLLHPDYHQLNEDITKEINQYLTESKDFNRTAAKVFKALLEMREKCDEARLEVIGKRSRLQMVETERNAAQLVLKALIKDKQDQLERLTQHHESLLRCEKDKEETLMAISQT